MDARRVAELQRLLRSLTHVDGAVACFLTRDGEGLVAAVGVSDVCRAAAEAFVATWIAGADAQLAEACDGEVADEILLTLDDAYHLSRALGRRRECTLYLVLERGYSNLARARHALAEGAARIASLIDAPEGAS